MQQYGSKYLNSRPPPGVKIQLYQNIVMLHIKLKGMMHAAIWQQIFYQQSGGGEGGQKVKIQLFQNKAMLHNKLMESQMQ